MSKYATILHEVVLPKLLEDDRFKYALADAVREIPIIEAVEKQALGEDNTNGKRT